jgi:hypothetical protein
MIGAKKKLGPLTLDLPAFFIGLYILLKGWEKLEHFEHHPLIVSLLFILGGVVVIGSLASHWLEKRVKSPHGVFHIIKGVAIALSAIILFEDGKLRILLLFFLIALVYLTLGVLESLPPSRRERYACVMQRAFGASFVVAGLTLAITTALHDADVWAFGAAALFIAIGVILLITPARISFFSQDLQGRSTECGHGLE